MQSDTNLYFIKLYYIIIPATYFCTICRTETCPWNYNLIEFNYIQRCVCIRYILYYISA